MNVIERITNRTKQSALTRQAHRLSTQTLPIRLRSHCSCSVATSWQQSGSASLLASLLLWGFDSLKGRGSEGVNYIFKPCQPSPLHPLEGLLFRFGCRHGNAKFTQASALLSLAVIVTLAAFVRTRYLKCFWMNSTINGWVWGLADESSDEELGRWTTGRWMNK